MKVIIINRYKKIIMNNILVTTDFSFAANNAIEYAANFAQRNKSKLTLVNFQLSEPVEEHAGCRYIRETPEMLKEMSETIHRNYSIPCDYIVEQTNKTLGKAIQALSSDADLIIMGTNGVDDIYQYIFGSTTYQVTKRSTCPVLIIPENVTFKPIEKVVFAWDYTYNSKVAFSQFNNLLKKDQPEITFLHISHKDTAVSDEVFQALKDSVSSQFPENRILKFVRVFSKDSENFPEKIVEYAVLVEADLLVTTHYERGVRNIFHGAMTRKLSELINCPQLVLHV